ncbi:MAG TPA: thioredoxin family protein [Geoalkalibacter subterraneus]|uniref:Thioredoxin family protein n=1 Tax=Geoalkalibacter subterraneus TaxID=483547 RepID=A0A831PK36_9BACT|nr:thioredoxin family protein [Geoalkalibacter subterraneus]
MKKVQILGTGCAKCNKLADNAKAAAQSLGQEIEVEKVSDLNEITRFGVLSTPGLVIDGKVVSQGKLLKPEQIAKLLAS